eukprot:356695-Chlamydomonas_euryale.AAC.4
MTGGTEERKNARLQQRLGARPSALARGANFFASTVGIPHPLLPLPPLPRAGTSGGQRLDLRRGCGSLCVWVTARAAVTGRLHQPPLATAMPRTPSMPARDAPPPRSTVKLLLCTMSAFRRSRSSSVPPAGDSPRARSATRRSFWMSPLTTASGSPPMFAAVGGAGRQIGQTTCGEDRHEIREICASVGRWIRRSSWRGIDNGS